MRLTHVSTGQVQQAKNRNNKIKNLRNQNEMNKTIYL